MLGTKYDQKCQRRVDSIGDNLFLKKKKKNIKIECTPQK